MLDRNVIYDFFCESNSFGVNVKKSKIKAFYEGKSEFLDMISWGITDGSLDNKNINKIIN